MSRLRKIFQSAVNFRGLFNATNYYIITDLTEVNKNTYSPELKSTIVILHTQPEYHKEKYVCGTATIPC